MSANSERIRQALARPSPTLWAVAIVCLVIEALLSAADARLFGSPLWRPLAYQYGAFWPGLLGNWSPNYPAQPGVMFLSYPFLHTGPAHVLGNIATLFVLGLYAERRLGQQQTWIIYAASALGGGAAFALLGDTAQPMVGASGALFGLAGAWLHDTIRTDHAGGSRLWMSAKVLSWLVFLNLLIWYLMAGRLAWETHLGGFLTGWAIAALLERRQSHP